MENGQTLWKISKLYNADLDEIAKVNHISNATKIETNQLIFIPNLKRAFPPAIRYTPDDFIWPLKGKVITAFGQTFDNIINKGINIQPYSNSDVVAARSGKVIFYKENFGYFGRTLIIDHGDGFLTVYSRNSRVFIKVGDNVRKGTVIAQVGSAPRDRNAYLHFEIRKGHICQNPFFYLP